MIDILLNRSTLNLLGYNRMGTLHIFLVVLMCGVCEGVPTIWWGAGRYFLIGGDIVGLLWRSPAISLGQSGQSGRRISGRRRARRSSSGARSFLGAVLWPKEDTLKASCREACPFAPRTMRVT
jgi:hypothetical protein